MGNIEKLSGQIGDILSEGFSKNIKRLEDLLKNDEMRTHLQQSLQKGLDQAAFLQKDGGKGSIGYVSFSLLLSSIISENYSFYINLYDKNFYLDEADACSEWHLRQVAQFVDSDLAEAESYLRRKQLPFSAGDFVEVKQAQAILYSLPYVPWLQTNMESIVEKLDIQNLECQNQVEITFGLYMESQEKIYSWEVKV